VFVLLESARYQVAGLTVNSVVVFAAFQIHQGLLSLILIGWRQGARRTSITCRDNLGKDFDTPSQGFSGIELKRSQMTCC